MQHCITHIHDITSRMYESRLVTRKRTHIINITPSITIIRNLSCFIGTENGTTKPIIYINQSSFVTYFQK